MNIANKLTCFRIVINFFFLIFLFIPAPGAKTVALGLFLIAVITDIYDGRIARRLNITTDFGKIMDPLADKILICSAFISFIQLSAIAIPAWMVALIVAREFSITALRLSALTKGKLISADIRGKTKMVVQSVTVLFGLIALSAKELAMFLPYNWNPGWDYYIKISIWILAFVTVIHTLVTGLYYIWDNRSLIVDSN